MLPSVAAQGGSDGVKPCLPNSLCVETLRISEALALTLPVLSPEEARERLKIAIIGLKEDMFFYVSLACLPVRQATNHGSRRSL